MSASHDELRGTLKLHDALPKEFRQAGNRVYAEAETLRALLDDRDRLERNRDMWKGQCERQAAQIEAMRVAIGRAT